MQGTVLSNIWQKNQPQTAQNPAFTGAMIPQNPATPAFADTMQTGAPTNAATGGGSNLNVKQPAQQPAAPATPAAQAPGTPTQRTAVVKKATPHQAYLGHRMTTVRMTIDQLNREIALLNPQDPNAQAKIQQIQQLRAEMENLQKEIDVYSSPAPGPQTGGY